MEGGRTTITQTPDVLLGGTPPSFIGPPALDFTTFRGCLFDFSYSTDESNPQLIISPENSTASQYVCSNTATYNHVYHYPINNTIAYIVILPINQKKVGQ